MPEPEYELEKLVTVETFGSPWEAQLARAVLESEGIEAVIADEHFLRLYGPLSNLQGGMRLQVRPQFAERAAELLRARRPILYLVTEEDDLPMAAEEPEEAEALVTVGRFYSPWEAHLARTLLESEGIDACVLEERLPAVSLLTGAPTALSRVEVHPADAGRALEILAEVQELEEDEEEAPASET
ncbi:MAG: putative signal transducing protein [Thermoanaerobaculia bacterium]